MNCRRSWLYTSTFCGKRRVIHRTWTNPRQAWMGEPVWRPRSPPSKHGSMLRRPSKSLWPRRPALRARLCRRGRRSCRVGSGAYKPECALGSGGFGTVYRCRDEQLERDVAVKLFNGAAERYGPTDVFLHEAKAAARLRHPGVVAVLDAGRTEDGIGFVVYELVRGSTLRDHIATGPVARGRAVRWLIEAAEALHAAHKCGIVHRDIKPANILIDDQDKARLADFGIAKLDDRFFLNDKGEVVGTMAYMSPEQAGGQSHWASPQSDIFSLGTVMYELLCGRTPFRGQDFEEIRQQILERSVQPPRTIDDSISKELEAVCLKALARSRKTASRRPPTWQRPCAGRWPRGGHGQSWQGRPRRFC